MQEVPWKGKHMYELIILSLLMSAPVHGYLIVKVMNDIVGPYTKLSHGRLYPLLAKLEQDGLIVASSEPAKGRAGGRNLRRFQITENGRRRFHEVMMDTTSNPAEYQKLFLHKVQAMEHLQPAERLFLLDHYLNFCQAHILYMTAKLEEVKHLENHHMSPSRFDALVKIMQHVINQWRLEFNWVNQLREEEQAGMR
jgi:DNA-binding PadR family transcriptional regulator